MNHQSVEIVVWLGFAMIAIVWANLSLWRARRLLARLRQSLSAPKSRPGSTVTEKPSSVMTP